MPSWFGKRKRLPDLEAHGVPPKRSFTTRLAGVTQNNPDGTKRQATLGKLAPGDIAALVREPQNPHDANAVAVVDPHFGQLGYIPAGLAALLADQLDGGLTGFARIKEITGGTRDKRLRGCAVDVLLYDPDTEIPDGLLP